MDAQAWRRLGSEFLLLTATGEPHRCGEKDRRRRKKSSAVAEDDAAAGYAVPARAAEEGPAEAGPSLRTFTVSVQTGNAGANGSLVVTVRLPLGVGRGAGCGAGRRAAGEHVTRAAA